MIPEHGPDTPETKDLVRDIRALKPVILERYDVPIAVTGFTAVAIDVSDRLGGALLPFGVLVVGLSLVLLTMVFRSVAVPLKATIGYLLSVGAAFGVTAMVFEYGWFSDFFNVAQTAPVISFLPILLMGILFGLAMDYEVFLVSRIREEYVHGGDAPQGYRGRVRRLVAGGDRGGRDHVRGLRRVRAGRRGADQDHRVRPGRGGVHRRFRGPDDLGARGVGHARPGGLVAAALDRPAVAVLRCRG